MKQFLFLLLVFACTISAAQVQKTDRSTKNLIGPVKSTHLVYFRGEEKFGELVKGHKEFTQTDEYSREGWLISTKLVDGSSVTKASYKYDKNGNLIEQKMDEDGEVITYRIKYNSEHKQTELDTYNDDDKLKTRLKTKYNADGQPESASLYYGDGSLKERTGFVYNDKNQLSEKATVDADEKMTSASMFEYNEKGRLVMELVMKKSDEDDVEITTTAYTYNARGQVSTKDYLLPDGKTKKDEYTYDDFGNVVMDYSDEENFESDTMTYDKKNNWTKKIRTFSTSVSVRKFIIERAVKYY